MTDTPKTKAEQHIETIMRQLDPSSPRYQVLVSARDFKSSWVTLGEQLQSVRRQQLFNDWGYASFEDYCLKEIRIKKPTALKLTNAYHFLEKQEPELLARQDGVERLPDFRAVDLLRQAQEGGSFSDENYQQLRQSVIEEGRSLPTIRQQFNAVARAAEPTDVTTQRNLKAALSAARRLQTLLESLPDLKSQYASATAELASHLEQQVNAAVDETD